MRKKLIFFIVIFICIIVINTICFADLVSLEPGDYLPFHPEDEQPTPHQEINQDITVTQINMIVLISAFLLILGIIIISIIQLKKYRRKMKKI